MKNRKLITITLLTCLLALGQAARADGNSHSKEVETLFRLTQMEQRIDETVGKLTALQIRQNPQLAAHEPLIRAFLARHVGWQAMRPELEAMYKEAFSEDDLKQMNAFYITPVGQKVLIRVPDLVQARNQLAAQRLKQHIGELRQEIESARADEQKVQTDSPISSQDRD